MENYLDILINACIAFDWWDWLRLFISSVLTCFVGSCLHATFDDLNHKKKNDVIIDISLAIIVFGLAVWCCKPFWHHPTDEIVITNAFWHLGWFLIGWGEYSYITECED